MSDTKHTEYFIARRISGRAGAERRNVMVRIATLTTIVSLSVMIIALAVILGFKQSITSRLIGFNGNVQIVHLDNNSSLETEPIVKSEVIKNSLLSLSGTSTINAYAIKGGIIKTDQAIQGIALKGYDTDFDWSFFSQYIVEGQPPHISDTTRTKDILISAKLCELLNLELDDRVEMLFIQEGRSPKRDRFKICGIYDTGFEETDQYLIATDIRNVQRLNSWREDMITGYELHGKDLSASKKYAQQVYESLMELDADITSGLMVTEISARYPNLFDWLKAHNVNAAVIIIIMLLVSFLNMTSALLIILLERTRMIGILKSLGMDNRAIQKIFIIRSSIIVIKGMIWGNVIGIGLCLFQKYTGIITLDQSGYMLSEVPVLLDPFWIVLLNAGVFILLTLLLTIPTLIITRIQPDTSMRYQ